MLLNSGPLLIAVNIILGICCFSSDHIYAGLPDSSSEKFRHAAEGFLSGSFISNYNSKKPNHFYFNAELEYEVEKTTPRRNTSIYLTGEIGYMKYIDSIWSKHRDNFRLSILINEKKSGRITASYAILLRSQFTTTWNYRHNGQGRQEKFWYSGPFNPGSAILSYGIKVDFWKRSFVNISFASLRLSTQPDVINILPEKPGQSRFWNSILNTEYGISFQSMIDKKLTRSFKWTNHTSCFFQRL